MTPLATPQPAFYFTRFSADGGLALLIESPSSPASSRRLMTDPVLSQQLCRIVIYQRYCQIMKGLLFPLAGEKERGNNRTGLGFVRATMPSTWHQVKPGLESATYLSSALRTDGIESESIYLLPSPPPRQPFFDFQTNSSDAIAWAARGGGGGKREEEFRSDSMLAAEYLRPVCSRRIKA